MHNTPTLHDAAMPLYQQALGASFCELAPVLQRLHGQGARNLSGHLRVRSSNNPLIRFFLWLTRMPNAQTNAACIVHLSSKVKNYKSSEIWHRSIATSRLVSRQYLSPKGRIIERFGPLSIYLNTVVRNGNIRQRSQGTRFLGIPLPGIFGVRVFAYERALDTNRVVVNIVIVSALFGRVLQYSGVLSLLPQT